MKRRSYLPLLSLMLCLAAAWMYASPYLAMRKLQRAAERGDVATLNEVVDFPALRTSVKDNVRSSVARGIQSDGGLAGALGGALAGALVSPLVDAAVTPTGIAALADGRDPRDRDGDDDEPRRERRVERGYEGLNRWVVSYRDAENGGEQIALIMRRDGLGWKLSGVRFGPDPK